MTGRHRRGLSKIKAAIGGMILLTVALFLIFVPLWLLVG